MSRGYFTNEETGLRRWSLLARFLRCLEVELDLELSPGSLDSVLSTLHSQLCHLLPAGPDPSEEAGTKARFSLSDDVEEGSWSASVLDQQDNVLALQLCTPANAPVGLYRLSLETSTGYQGSSFVLGHFVLLFNAWCPGELFSGGLGSTHYLELVT